MKKTLKFFKRLVIFILALVLLIVIPIGINKLYNKIHASTLDQSEKQLEDIYRLDYLMKNEFALYPVSPHQSAYLNHIERLKAKVGGEGMSEEAFALEIIKAVATFKDPHCVVYNTRELFSEYFPYRIKWYDGDFYLTSGQVDEKWLGASVKSFNGIDAQEVFEKLSTYTFAPNDFGSAYFMGYYQALPEFYHHEGIIDDPNHISLDLVLQDGESTQIEFTRMSREAINALPDYVSLSSKFKDKQKPLWKTQAGKHYWYEYLEPENTFYLRYAFSVAQGDIEVFWQDVFNKLEELKPEKMILDLRGNPGGDAQNHVSFVKRMVENPLNERGKLFTLIDRGTGSAAIGLASDMEKYTNTILVGEKTIDNPNTTSDPTFFTLPHSGVTLLVPNLYAFNSHIHDQRDAVYPDYFVSESVVGDDYNQDKVLDYIFANDFSRKPPEYASLPEAYAGSYSFSPIRHFSLEKAGNTWWATIEGLVRTPLYLQDSTIVSDQYDMELAIKEELPTQLHLKLHGSDIVLQRLPDNEQSLMQAIEERDFDLVRNKVEALRAKQGLPYYLGRPFFQTQTYKIYREDGFDHAYAFNQITKSLWPNDPVISIVDYELYEYNGNTLGQVGTILPILGKLLGRYYNIVTTERVMNDQYNAFIGKD